MKSLYGYATKTPLNFKKAMGTNDLYYIEEIEVHFQDLINATIPKCPREVSFTSHWLAVEGLQPAIRQNPPPPPAALPTNVLTPVTTIDPKKNAEIPALVKGTVNHTLSIELQTFYDTITKGVMNTNPQFKDVQEKVYISLLSDPSVHHLLPYLTQFISDQITQNLQNLPVLKNILRMINSILHNQHIHVEPYLHQLMPSILTCLVGKTLCVKPLEDHFSLRDSAASTIAYIIQKFSSSYHNLQPRITKTLFHAYLDTSKPLTTHYGAIIGLEALGPATVKMLLLPNISTYLKLLQPELNSENPVRVIEARKCYNALLNIAGNYLHKHMTAHSPDENVNASIVHNSNAKDQLIIEMPDAVHYYKELYNIFGESLTPFLQSTSGDATHAF